MYGLLIQSIVDQIKSQFGENVWDAVRAKTGIPHHSFVTHKKYSETLIPRIARATSEVTGTPIEELTEQFGFAFVEFVGQYGYDRILRVLGRHMRDFLNGLDNLHEYLRFSYPKLKPPSFFIEDETKDGLTLHYRSKRKGFLHYVKGQIRQVGKIFYNTNVEIEVINVEENMDMTHVVMRLHFDNTAFNSTEQTLSTPGDTLHVSSEVFFDVFPFHIVFNRQMLIRSIGGGLTAVMPRILGQAIDEAFVILRPLVNFSLENVLAHTNNVFELRSVDSVQRVSCPVNKYSSGDSSEAGTCTFEESCDDENGRLRLKGQMMRMSEWDCVMFLGTPAIETLDMMFDVGLYINDLSMHDSSRDLVLAGTQQSAELKLALDQEQQKSKKLEESMMKLDVEMRRTDELLYQMIPKQVADRLRRGDPAMTTCEVFQEVTILFSDVVGFTRICSQISPMGVVSMLNGMYTRFDKLSEKYQVYKVETIGDAYMVVSGAPTVTKFHAIYICDMAFAMRDSMYDLKDPSTDNNMEIRVGIHSGTVVAGVVGLKMPRYCLFGDTVNTASRMETNGEAMKLHVSETTMAHFDKYPCYIFEQRGTIDVKGKGVMKTYWLVRKDKSLDSKFSIDAMLEKEKDTAQNNQNQNIAPVDTGMNYKPVTFDEIAKSTSSLGGSSNASQLFTKSPGRVSNKQSVKDVPNGNKATLGVINNKHNIPKPGPISAEVTKKENNISIQNNLSDTNMHSIKHGDKIMDNDDIMSEKKIPNEQANNSLDIANKLNNDKKEKPVDGDASNLGVTSSRSKTCQLV